MAQRPPLTPFNIYLNCPLTRECVWGRQGEFGVKLTRIHRSSAPQMLQTRRSGGRKGPGVHSGENEVRSPSCTSRRAKTPHLPDHRCSPSAQQPWSMLPAICPPPASKNHLGARAQFTTPAHSLQRLSAGCQCACSALSGFLGTF